MPNRTMLSLTALAAAVLYAAQGVLELTHEQPEVFADAVDYWIETLFAAALLAGAVVLFALARARLSGVGAMIGFALAAAGSTALLVAAIFTAIEGRDSLEPLFGLGFLAVFVGYVTLAVVDLRSGLIPARAGLILLIGFVAAVLVDDLGAGGLVLAVSWAALSRLLQSSETPAAGR